MDAVDRNLRAFGDRLRGIRLEKRLNQADFAALAGTSANSQVTYERGQTSPTLTYLYRLAHHGVDIGHLLTGQPNAGELGFEQGLLVEMFEKLSIEGRQSLITLLMELTGRATSIASLDAQARSARLTLQDKKSGYRAPEAE